MRYLQLIGVFTAVVFSTHLGPTVKVLASDCDSSCEQSNGGCDDCVACKRDRLSAFQFECQELNRCDCNGTRECDCSGCCNNGLLDMVDRVAVRIHHRLSRMTGLFRAEFGVGSQNWGCLECDIGGTGSAVRVGGSQTGDCDGRSNCDGCPTCSEAVDSSASKIEDSRESPPIPVPQTSRPTEGRTYTGMKKSSSTLHDEDESRLGGSDSQPPIEVPQVPRKLPAQLQVPDTLVNPFDDESPSDNSLRGAGRSEGRGVSGRTIQYQRGTRPQQPDQKTNPQPVKLPTYGQRFDPQARNGTSSADYWAEFDEQLTSQTNRVTTVSDQPPTLHRIHRRAYSLKLADQQTIDGQSPTDAQEISLNLQTEPSNQAAGAKSDRPQLAPVRPTMRLKSKPASTEFTPNIPYENPLR